MILKSIFKKDAFSALCDVFFPPLCLSCRERSKTKFLCLDCWALCSPIDPAERCRHCFKELDQRGLLCSRCRKGHTQAFSACVFDAESPAYLLSLEKTEAMAGFAFFQWVQLDWPLPHAIIPLPDANSIAIGMILALLMEVPFVRALQGDYGYKEDRLEEEQILLLFGTYPQEKAIFHLSEALAKSLYVLTLF